MKPDWRCVVIVISAATIGAGGASVVTPLIPYFDRMFGVGFGLGVAMLIGGTASAAAAVAKECGKKK